MTADAHLMLTRRLIWDMLPHDDRSIREDFERLGIPFGSDDVAEMEHAESHLRTIPCIVLAPYINQLASISSEIVLSMLKNTNPGFHPDVIQMQQEICEPVIRSSSSVIIAHLISAGLLSLDDGTAQDTP